MPIATRAMPAGQSGVVPAAASLEQPAIDPPLIDEPGGELDAGAGSSTIFF